MSRALVLAAALASVAAAISPTYEPEETAVAAFTDAARLDLGAMCELCLRVDPEIDCASWGPTVAHPPFHYQPIAAGAARFHARHLFEGPCFQHDSCCELEQRADGTVRCATPQCSSCDTATECPGTPTGERYALLGYTSDVGENIAAGSRNAFDVTCGWLDSKGHRENILTDYDELGVGRYSGTSQCFERYWVQALGSVRDSPAPGYVAAGGVMEGTAGPPLGTPGDTSTAVAFIHDPARATAAPLSVRAVIDGGCVALAPAVGEGGRALFAASFTATPGCHEAWFLALDAEGRRHTFPPTGALAFAVGDARCPIPAERGPAACEGTQACSTPGARKPCYRGAAGTEGIGLCHGGVAICADGAFATCDGQVLPGAERCNGLDDDCDGRVDEEASDIGASCESGRPGRCAAGTFTCHGGGPVCTAARAPIEERCNGEDDDCDGVVDDGLGQLVCGEGACRRVVKGCADGVVGTCIPGVALAAEVCGNGLDEDCDASPDDGCPCSGGTRACYVGPEGTLGIGACRAGIQHCKGGVWDSCEDVRLPARETCDGKDDDCDGRVDDGLGSEACGVGGCLVAVSLCQRGRLVTCEPRAAGAESCNGVDDSCEGEVDEGCTCRTGATTACAEDWSTANVGSCRAGARTCLADGSGFGPCLGELRASAEQCGNQLDDDCDGSADEGCAPPVVDEEERGGCGCAAGLAGLPALLGLLARRRRARGRG